MSKTQVEEINRNIYDIKNKDEYDFKIKKGLTPEIIEEISKQKNDPDWMKEVCRTNARYGAVVSKKNRKLKKQ